MPEVTVYGSDAFLPRQIAEKIESGGVAAGFEHSVANMYLIPAGILLADAAAAGAGAPQWAGLARNLVPVTLGNVFGGSVLVALVYFVIYRRGEPKRDGGRDRETGGPA